MFSRTIPRAAPRIGAAAQCSALAHAHKFAASSRSQWQTVQKQLGRRNASYFSSRFANIRQISREQMRVAPIMFPIAAGSVILLAGCLVFYVPWYYHNVIVKPYHAFPEEVAAKLRKAFFYTRGRNPDLWAAAKHFRQALQTANEIGMHPFSPEVMGIKYTIAAVFENQNKFDLAIDVLELLRTDARKYLEEGNDEFLTENERIRIKKDVIKICVKLGELYDVQYVNEPKSAEKRLSEAVESALAEKMRRERDGVREGEEPWLSDEEMGGTLEALANHYEQFDTHYLAAPLYLKALEYAPKNSCHAVILMNNLSTSLAQQSPSTSTPSTLSPAASSFPITTPPSRSHLLTQASAWATKALAHASSVPSNDRTEECAMGCAVATHNLGEFLEMQGRYREAREKYDEAWGLSKKFGFSEGVKNAREGSKRCGEKERDGVQADL